MAIRRTECWFPLKKGGGEAVCPFCGRVSHKHGQGILAGCKHLSAWDISQAVFEHEFTPGEAWEFFVGSQTPAEFVSLSGKAPEEAAREYVAWWSEEMSGFELDEDEQEEIASLLFAYINKEEV